MMTPDDAFEAKITEICDKDSRYDPDAYFFLREGMDFAIRERKGGKGQHLSGREVSEGLRDYALSEFGPMARFVLSEWGLHSTSDFGNLVYNLIHAEVFSKTPKDRREDFNDVYDFHQTFTVPYLP